MNSSKERVAVEHRQPAARGEQADQVMRPAVDIYENEGGITLYADLPGVAREDLHLKVDRDTLTIEGDTHFDLQEGIEALYADVRLKRYRRSFSLSQELDIDGINAGLKDGVLTVSIPKRAEVQPRRIEVRHG
jgi:HSP20 family molecular chaperone IbpA